MTSSPFARNTWEIVPHEGMMKMLRSLKSRKDQRFQELDERLATGGSRGEGESNSGKEVHDGVQIGGSLPVLVECVLIRLERNS